MLFIFQHILVDERDREHMEPHLRLDALLRPDHVRSLFAEHSRAVQR